jgi:hypothetical protein
MGKQLLSGSERRTASLTFICCLWIFAFPAVVKAQAAFSGATCSVQKVSGGGMTTWQIRGVTSVTGLDPKNASTTVTFTFQRMAKGAKDWTDLTPTVQQTTNGVGGTANFDTGWQGMSAAPGQGDQYRVFVNGY